MKVFTIQFTEDELTELENVLDQHVYAEAIENKGSEGTIGTIHNRILDVHYQNSDGSCASSRSCTQTLPQGLRLAIISTYTTEDL